ncbi:MAG TPA: YicC family protein [Gammaproteobacteria bacterium]|nr:YicC family protein [Gammaproteobacteria bacterium]HPI95004.1 YicC family protein [Gammaproteobacteria bacterium]HPQ86270.1 YicC family protein [Gammaproteobacteria bacterium]
MLKSMTAFASGDVQTEFGRFTCEIRSVNQRFLDITLRQPDFLRKAEGEIRKLVGKYISRGKVEIFIKYYPNPDADIEDLSVNMPLLNQLLECSSEIQNKVININTDFNTMDLLKWPQIIIQTPKNTAKMEQSAIELIEDVVKSLIEARVREGESLKAVLLEKLDTIIETRNIVEKHIPEIQQSLKERLLAKLDEMKIDCNEERFEQELALLLQKSDIIEETDRLNTHIQEIQRVIDLDEPVGRRLDFLIQELHREANTIGSKSATVLTSQSSIDMKVAIEQMREQIQNIE